MNFPENLKYTKDHEWIKIEGNIGTIGITEHAAGELGDVVYIDIPDAGAEVSQHDTFGTIEAVKTVADLFSPVSGKITEVNSALNDAPETVNQDPYNEGWIVKMELTNMDEVAGLMNAAAYRELVGQ
jgi:glycine cleavage system H protein